MSTVCGVSVYFVLYCVWMYFCHFSVVGFLEPTIPTWWAKEPPPLHLYPRISCPLIPASPQSCLGPFFTTIPGWGSHGNKGRRVSTWDMFSLLSYLCSFITGLFINIIYFQLVTFSLPQPNFILLATMPTIAREFPVPQYHNLLSELSKASGHKASVQKSVVFLLY